MRSYMVNICPECGAQQADGTDTHFHGPGRCPNAGRVWAPRAVEVVPACWAEVADDLAEALAEALAAYRALAGEEVDK